MKSCNLKAAAVIMKAHREHPVNSPGTDLSLNDFFYLTFIIRLMRVWVSFRSGLFFIVNSETHLSMQKRATCEVAELREQNTMLDSGPIRLEQEAISWGQISPNWTDEQNIYFINRSLGFLIKSMHSKELLTCFIFNV